MTIEAGEETEEEADGLPIWPENWTSLTAWLSIDTQWRVAGRASRLTWIGLDYSAVKVVLDAEGHGPEIFADIRMMEAEALPILNEAD